MHTPNAFRPRPAQQQGMAMVTTMLFLLGLMALTLLGVVASTRNAQFGNGNGAISSTDNTMRMSAVRMQQTVAFNLAESGVACTIQWLHHLGSPPAMTQAFPLPRWDQLPGAPQAVYPMGGQLGTQGGQLGTQAGSGSFTVTIYPDSANQTAATNGSVLKRYLIESVGRCTAPGTIGTITSVVRAYVRQNSFGKYAFFTDKDPADIHWVGGINYFDGPVHSNNSDGNKTNIIWYDGKPLYGDQSTQAFTYSGGVNWYHNGTSATAPTGAPDSLWTSVASYGQSGVNQTSAVPMPTVSTTQQYAAMGQTPPGSGVGTPSGVPTGNANVVVPPNGGVYVHGPVKQMVLGVSGGNQTITIMQTAADGRPLATLLTLTTTGTQMQQAELTDNNLPDTVNGTNVDKTTYHTSTTSTKNNGVVYCDSGVGNPMGSPVNGNPVNGNPVNGTRATTTAQSTAGEGLSGTIADHQGLTITAPNNTFNSDSGSPDTTGTININGSVTYQTPRAKDANGKFLPESDPANAAFVANAGTLGLVANAVNLDDNDSKNAALGDVELDATVMAYQTLRTVDGQPNTLNNSFKRPPHNFNCMGGEIAGIRGVLGTININNGVTTQNSGLAGHYSYDGRMANTPPPFFPTTSTAYDILSWQRVRGTL